MGALLSPPLYGTDRSERSQGDRSGESVIDESEALKQIRSIYLAIRRGYGGTLILALYVNTLSKIFVKI